MWVPGQNTTPTWWTDRESFPSAAPLLRHPDKCCGWEVWEEKLSPRHMKRWPKLFLTFPKNGKIKPFAAETVARAMWLVCVFFSLIVSVSIQSNWCTIFYLFSHVFGLVKWHKLTLNFSWHRHGNTRHAILAPTSNAARLGSSLKGENNKKTEGEKCKNIFCFTKTYFLWKTSILSLSTNFPTIKFF